jgi:hybrid cluster-associated redox disulfide protein
MSEKVTKKMTLGEVVSKYPEAAEVMLNHGLHCVGCHVALWETIEQGALAHGMNEKELKEMLEEINKKINEKKGVK